MKYTREQIENYISRIEFICNGITIDASGIDMLRQLLSENDALQSETMEQCRIIGMSAEREDKLRSENDAMREDAKKWRFIEATADSVTGMTPRGFNSVPFNWTSESKQSLSEAIDSARKHV